MCCKKYLVVVAKWQGCAAMGERAAEVIRSAMAAPSRRRLCDTPVRRIASPSHFGLQQSRFQLRRARSGTPAATTKPFPPNPHHRKSKPLAQSRLRMHDIERLRASFAVCDEIYYNSDLDPVGWVRGKGERSSASQRLPRSVLVYSQRWKLDMYH
jgi:hypothetical protein